MKCFVQGGDITCALQECPPLSCGPMERVIHEDGQCCETCQAVAEAKCYYQGRTFQVCCFLHNVVVCYYQGRMYQVSSFLFPLCVCHLFPSSFSLSSCPEARLCSQGVTFQVSFCPSPVSFSHLFPHEAGCTTTREGHCRSVIFLFSFISFFCHL